MTAAHTIPAGTWGETITVPPLAGDGTGVGLAVGCDPAHPGGNQSNGIDFARVWVRNFDVGWQIGDDQGHAASELTFTNCKAETCETGFQCDDYNTLNLLWEVLNVSGCGIGLDTGRAGAVNVVGGSASNCGVVFRFPSAGVYTVNTVRSEDCPLFCTVGVGGGQAVTSVTLDNCHTRKTTPGSDVIVYGGGCLTMRGGIYAGHVEYRPVNNKAIGEINLNGVRTLAKDLLDAPAGAKFKYDIRNCALLDKDNVVKEWLPDVSGTTWPPQGWRRRF